MQINTVGQFTLQKVCFQQECKLKYNIEDHPNLVFL